MSASTARVERDLWPELPLEAWQDTYATLHMWTQIVGKVRLALTPKINHWWGVPLYVSALGLTTTAIPYAGGSFEIEFDFVHHRLAIQTSREEVRVLALRPQTVRDFYQEFMSTMAALGIDVKIWRMPVEIPDPIPFDEDTKHASYDPEYANRFWRILMCSEAVFQEFRAKFIGKASPVHFFWGSFDLAATRFSGRRAPEREGADSITREAYSHEVISAGFWPGGGEVRGAAYYAYAAPEPAGFAQYPVRPQEAFYHTQLREFILMYDDMRKTASPRKRLMEFLESTYVAGAELGKWNRKELEQ
ncbi:MAG TPA: DUF5996 family protein [Candidatus Acidoferrum sp.]|nr:DUF5996 family protein [Candidatus Acidoferrum sp.]